jgi:glycosyltransferase involved in cell wall biosynthesis
VKVAVLTTSYPRTSQDNAGRFVADAVEHLRAEGIEVEVVSPLSFHHFGIAYGHGVVGNLRRRPWLWLLVPAMLVSFTRAARRAARNADVVHAHWLPAGLVGAFCGRPLVVQPWGTDVTLAKSAPWAARRVLRRARLAICASGELADAARELGAREARVIPNGIDVPVEVVEPDEPPHILFAGRLSAEKGVRELVAATEGLPLVVAGDGPLRDEVPGALGMVPHDELLRLYERATVVVCPSLREGFGVACLEAMAAGRPVVASAVGGLRDLVVDGETGLLVPPGDVAALRAALERLLGDAVLRRRLGHAARERVLAGFTWKRYAELVRRAYDDART